MADILRIFEPTAEPEKKSAFNLDELTEQFRQQRNTDWTVPEAFLCLVLSAAAVDGNVSIEEQEEIRALARRSRALKSIGPNQLAGANAAINKRLQNRPDGLKEACQSLPVEMRLPVFAHCADIILADGALHPAEADFLNRILAFLGLQEAEAKHVMEVLLIKNRF